MIHIFIIRVVRKIFFDVHLAPELLDGVADFDVLNVIHVEFGGETLQYIDCGRVSVTAEKTRVKRNVFGALGKPSPAQPSNDSQRL